VRKYCNILITGDSSLSRCLGLNGSPRLPPHSRGYYYCLQKFAIIQNIFSRKYNFVYSPTICTYLIWNICILIECSILLARVFRVFDFIYIFIFPTTFGFRRVLFLAGICDVGFYRIGGWLPWSMIATRCSEVFKLGAVTFPLRVSNILYFGLILHFNEFAWNMRRHGEKLGPEKNGAAMTTAGAIILHPSPRLFFYQPALLSFPWNSPCFPCDSLP